MHTKNVFRGPLFYLKHFSKIINISAIAMQLVNKEISYQSTTIVCPFAKSDLFICILIWILQFDNAGKEIKNHYTMESA